MSTNMLMVAEAAWASVLAQTFLDTIRANAIAGKKLFGVKFDTVLTTGAAKLHSGCLVVHSAKTLTSREACSLLAAYRIEAHPFLPAVSDAPSNAHGYCFDSILLVEAPTLEEVHDPLRQLPGFNFDENLMARFRKVNVDFLLTTELRAREEFSTYDWVHGALSGLDEAILRIKSKADALFYIG
ncbi:hypothetical protein LT330_007222 [Penicillium expansum]|nr:hypothetical protein LT330_007222 [Penicillium expansum]